MNHSIPARKKKDIMREQKVMALGNANIPVTCDKFSIPYLYGKFKIFIS